jgi:NADPH-dependent curcumin reductase CurA
VICGAISQYGDMHNVTGPRNYLKLAERHASMEGFTVLHFANRFAEARDDIGGWLADGSLVEHNHVERGIEQFAHALDLLLTGGHRGKLLVDVSGNA